MATMEAETRAQLDVEKAGRSIRENDKVRLVNGYRMWVYVVGGISLIIWFLVMWNTGWGYNTSSQTQAYIPPTPLTTEQQAAAKLLVEQEAERVAAQRVIEAAAVAKAAEAARLITNQSKNLPTSVKVPHCDIGWSKEILIPANWFVQADWGGKAVLIQILKDGEWERQMTLNVTGQIAAVRYCTTSEANLSLRGGLMALNWTPN